MGRGKGQSGATAGMSRRAIDPTRLLSVKAPVVTGRDVAATGDAAADRMTVVKPFDGPSMLAAADRIGGHLPAQYRGTRPPLEDINLVASGDTAYKYTGAAYRGHVGIAKDASGKPEWVGFCTYGSADGDNANVLLRSPDLEKVVKKVNSQMQSKVRGNPGQRKYEPDSRNPDDAKLTTEKVVEAFLARDPWFGGTPA